MSTNTLSPTPQAETEPGGAEPTPSSDHGARGTTRCADRVVEKIAARAVDEVDAARGAARRVLGVPLTRDAGQHPARVNAEVDGDLVTVAVEMALTYPAPIRRTTREVRHHVIARVRELAGLTVKEVDIEIVRLTGEDTPTRRVR